MCLTGVDYFSTLGYQPSIAFLAAGYLSPFATMVLVLLTLFGALPVYSRIAGLSPYGQGSLSVLERYLPRWRGKTFVLCLLGFAATDFVITITLSAADATAHVVENPFFPHWLDHPVGLTLALIAALGLIFLKGFREAIWLAVALVILYLGLNAIILGRELMLLVEQPEAIAEWRRNLFAQQSNPLMMVLLTLLLFPKLALGLSGFETGVAVMPLVRGDGETAEEILQSRIQNTRKLLLTAALIMSGMLIASAVVTATRIPGRDLQAGGLADGRALAYLAHRDFGDLFGTLYDLSTIAILWFAGASAMAGLLNLVPKYLPRYGMAPDWARASRPLVIVIAAIAFVVTVAFEADVNAQGGAYATGVLVLITSAAIAVTIAMPYHRRWFMLITLVFVYTTVVNVIERPEGIQIASLFILGSSVRRWSPAFCARPSCASKAWNTTRPPSGSSPKPPGASRSGSLRIARIRASPPSTRPSSSRRAAITSSALEGIRPVSRGSTRRCLGLFRCSACGGRQCRRLQGSANDESGDPERDSRAAARPAKSHVLHSPRLLRMDRRQSTRLPAEISGVR